MSHLKVMNSRKNFVQTGTFFQLVCKQQRASKFHDFVMSLSLAFDERKNLLIWVFDEIPVVRHEGMSCGYRDR